MIRVHPISRVGSLAATALLLASVGCRSRAAAGALESRADSLVFDALAVGRLSAAQVIEWSNVGVDTLALAELSVAGPAAADFVVAEDLCGGISLAPGESCSAAILFGPRAAGPREATIVASVEGEAAAVELRGEGIAEAAATIESTGLVRAVPETLDFGEQPLGAVAGPLGIRLVNQRSGPVQFAVRLRTTQGSEYRIALDRCSNEILRSGRACAIQVLFEPAAEGLRAGELILRDLNGPEIQSVPLTGTGVAALTSDGSGSRDEPPVVSLALSVSPRSIEFGVHATGSPGSPREVRIKNEGASNVIFRSLRIAGSDPDAFRISRDDCGNRALVPTRTCSLEVVFQPVAPGAQSARIEAQTTTGREPALVLLGGTGGAR